MQASFRSNKRKGQRLETETGLSFLFNNGHLDRLCFRKKYKGSVIKQTVWKCPLWNEKTYLYQTGDVLEGFRNKSKMKKVGKDKNEPTRGYPFCKNVSVLSLGTKGAPLKEAFFTLLFLKECFVDRTTHTRFSIHTYNLQHTLTTQHLSMYTTLRWVDELRWHRRQGDTFGTMCVLGLLRSNKGRGSTLPSPAKKQRVALLFRKDEMKHHK